MTAIHIIGHLRCFVHRLAHTVASVFSNHRVPRGFYYFLNALGDIGNMISGLCVLDPVPERFLCHADQALSLFRDLTASERCTAVPVEAASVDALVLVQVIITQAGAHVHRDDVPFFQPILAGNAVDDLIIDGDASGAL
jgi:hypothetical protein